MSQLCLVLILLLICVGVPLKTAMDYRNARSIPDVWGKIADKNGLTLIPGKFSSLTFSWPCSPVVTGTYRSFDYNLTLKDVKTGYYKGREMHCTYTVMNINLPVNINRKLYIYKGNRNIVDKQSKNMVMLKEVSSGDPEFDKIFTVQADIQANINKIFTPELMQKMVYDRDIINISFEGRNLHYETVGIIRDIYILQNLTEIMGELATNLSALGAEIQALPEQRVSQSEWICPSCNTSVSFNSIYCINCGQNRQT
ncbi:MAG: DUF3137 domain-containing protein [Candidatus Eremiobacterota bacterium]